MMIFFFNSGDNNAALMLCLYRECCTGGVMVEGLLVEIIKCCLGAVSSKDQ